MEGLGSYGASSDSEDDEPPSAAGASASGGAGAAAVAETSETETEDEDTPRTAPVRVSQAAASAASAAAAAAAAAAKPAPAVGARIVIKPAPAIVIGDDPDAQRDQAAAAAAADAAEAALGAEDEVPPALDELCARFLGPEVDGPAEGAGAAATSALQEKVVQTLTRYHQGGPHYVEHMRTNHAFRNPEILTKLVQILGVDPYGSNFDPVVFDPKGYKEEDYIGAIFEQQKAWLRRCEAGRQARGGIDFVPGLAEASVQQDALASASAAAGAAAAVSDRVAAAAGAGAAPMGDAGAAGNDEGPNRKRSKWGAAPSEPAGGAAAVVPPAPSTGNPYADFVAMKQREAAAAAAAAAAANSNGGAT
jgi:hypothetical protein